MENRVACVSFFGETHAFGLHSIQAVTVSESDPLIDSYLKQHPLEQVPSDVLTDTFAADDASQQPALQDAETDTQQSQSQASQLQIPVSQQQLPSGQQPLHSQAAGCPLQHSSETRP